MLSWLQSLTMGLVLLVRMQSDFSIYQGVNASHLSLPSRKLAPGEKEGWFPILIDLALIALAIAINVYVFQEADNISRRLKYVEDVTNLDLFYGTGLVLLVLEATRRTSGWPLVIVSGSFLAYAMFGE